MIIPQGRGDVKKFVFVSCRIRTNGLPLFSAGRKRSSGEVIITKSDLVEKDHFLLLQRIDEGVKIGYSLS